MARAVSASRVLVAAAGDGTAALTRVRKLKRSAPSGDVPAIEGIQ
jgi:hypothetical protein